ncbi:hypothetical protein Bbelb_072690 [Branchiostoma belcheri]|nr:hypothetical protein Bbelb_072690 [Branchiostoma belcheri]
MAAGGAEHEARRILEIAEGFMKSQAAVVGAIVSPVQFARREEAAVHLFERMLRDDHPLHDLVPPTRSAATGLSLRNAERISLPPARTKRLRNSFLHCAIRLYNNRPTLDTQ